MESFVCKNNQLPTENLVELTDYSSMVVFLSSQATLQVYEFLGKLTYVTKKLAYATTKSTTMVDLHISLIGARQCA